MTDSIIVELKDVVGEQTGKKYSGRFEFRRYLNGKQKQAFSRFLQFETQGMNRDTTQFVDEKDGLTYSIPQDPVYSYIQQVAFFNAHLIKAEDATWLPANPLELDDEAPIWALTLEIRKALKAEQDARQVPK